MPESASGSGLDLTTLASLYDVGHASPRAVLANVLDQLGARPDSSVWIHVLPHDEVLNQARAVERRRAAGETLPLYGVPFAVKDNIDVAGQPTTAACPAFRYTARESAPVVRCLQEAGAVLVGKTNLDQFATGLAGDRTPYGAARNPFDAAFIAGGSSSGSAVAVATGRVGFALGTDTAGSGRVPAGCTSIVGLKPTPGLLSTAGVVPACRSLDCVSILALTADDALRIALAARGMPWPPDHRPGADGLGFTFACPRASDLEFFGDADQAHLFAQSLQRLEQMGGRRTGIDFAPFREVASLLYEGPWLAERLAAVEAFVAGHADEMHPVTRAILAGGTAYSAVDVFKGFARLEALRPTCLRHFEQAEMLVVPTMPTIPTLADVLADSRGWSRRLGHYTNFANLLGLAALSLPAGFTPRNLPVSITLLGPPNSERRLCERGQDWQRRSNLPLGATGRSLPSRPTTVVPPVPENHVRVAVAGAHLRGQPLHADLLHTGARFVCSCLTAPRYRFLALLDLAPPRPGLLRDENRAGAISVEVYDLPLAGFGTLVASVAPPLAIGTIELEDGQAIKGFLCESWAAERARDITDFGGWIAFRKA